MHIGDSNKTVLLKVALRKESVDRNYTIPRQAGLRRDGRSPQGERG